MTIPRYEFLQRDAAQHQAPKRFTDVLIESGRFYRDERGLVQYKIADGDWILIQNKHALQEILLSGDAVEISGDLSPDDFATMWLWFTARRFAFPRLNPERAWQPDKPLPVRFVGSRVRR